MNVEVPCERIQFSRSFQSCIIYYISKKTAITCEMCWIWHVEEHSWFHSISKWMVRKPGNKKWFCHPQSNLANSIFHFMCSSSRPTGNVDLCFSIPSPVFTADQTVQKLHEDREILFIDSTDNFHLSRQCVLEKLPTQIIYF